jgi:serine/threonine-protein kinase
MVRYKMGRKIGEGGFGVVYLATQLDDGAQFAAKRLQHSASEEMRARFAREVRLQAKLRHPNVMPVLSYSLDDSRPWIVMPLADQGV